MVKMPAMQETWVQSLGSSQPRDRTRISCDSCTAGGFFTTEPPGKPISQISFSCFLLFNPCIQLAKNALFLPLPRSLQLFPLFHLSRLIYSTPPSAITSCIPFFSTPSLYLSSCSSQLSHLSNNECSHKTCWCHLCWCSIFSNKKAQVLDKSPSFTVEAKIVLLVLLSILLLLY